ncbi:MAG TPA: hypothetical protein V6D14_15730 [Coleofasciculaceae cyanobacterium]
MPVKHYHPLKLSFSCEGKRSRWQSLQLDRPFERPGAIVAWRLLCLTYPAHCDRCLPFP